MIEAAVSTGVPERTIYRRLKSGALVGRKESGLTLVQVGAVRRVARSHHPAPGAAATPAAGTPPDRAGGGGTSPARSSVEDGDLAARVFEHFDDGASPITVVRSLRLAPDRVRSLHREWLAMREVDRSAPTAIDRVGGVARRLEETEAALGLVALDLAAANDRIAKLESRVAGMPMPSAPDFVCPACWSRGFLAADVACTACGCRTQFGVRPAT